MQVLVCEQVSWLHELTGHPHPNDRTSNSYRSPQGRMTNLASKNEAKRLRE